MERTDQKAPSILTQAEQAIEQSPDGFAAGVIVQGKDLGAEISHVQDVGKPGGWTLAGVARIATTGRMAALFAKWQGK